jgi:hypothetical protein
MLEKVSAGQRAEPTDHTEGMPIVDHPKDSLRCGATRQRQPERQVIN